MTSPSPNEPTGVGEIVSTGWRLYTSNFTQYLLIAFVATLWSLVPTALNLLLNLGSVYLVEPPSPGLTVLSVLALIVVSIFCTAQSLGHFAAISRLAYQSLSGTTESPEAALRFTHARKFSFLGATLLQSLVIFFVSIALGLLFGAFIGVAAIVLGVSGDNPSVGVLFGLLTLVGFVAIFSPYLYILARLTLIEQPIAIEPSSGAFDALSRSWQLTKHHVGKAMLVAFLVSLIMFAIFLIAIGIVAATTFGSTFEVLSAPNVEPEELISALTPFYIAFVTASIAISIAVLPLVKTTFTALYFDLRNRSERRAFRENLQTDPASNL